MATNGTRVASWLNQTNTTGMPELEDWSKANDSNHTQGTTDLFHHSIAQRYQVAEYSKPDIHLDGSHEIA